MEILRPLHHRDLPAVEPHMRKMEPARADRFRVLLIERRHEPVHSCTSATYRIVYHRYLSTRRHRCYRCDARHANLPRRSPRLVDSTAAALHGADRAPAAGGRPSPARLSQPPCAHGTAGLARRPDIVSFRSATLGDHPRSRHRPRSATAAARASGACRWPHRGRRHRAAAGPGRNRLQPRGLRQTFLVGTRRRPDRLQRNRSARLPELHRRHRPRIAACRRVDPLARYKARTNRSAGGARRHRGVLLPPHGPRVPRSHAFGLRGGAGMAHGFPGTSACLAPLCRRCRSVPAGRCSLCSFTTLPCRRRDRVPVAARQGSAAPGAIRELPPHTRCPSPPLPLPCF